MAQKHDFSLLVVQRVPEGGVVVRFRARRLLGESILDKARKELPKLVAPERLLLIDLTNVEYLSSELFELLIRTQRALRRVAGNLSLCGARPEIDEVFRICKLDRTFDIYPDLESALGRDSAEAS